MKIVSYKFCSLYDSVGLSGALVNGIGSMAFENCIVYANFGIRSTLSVPSLSTAKLSIRSLLQQSRSLILAACGILGLAIA